MTVLEKLKLLIECGEWYTKEASYADLLVGMIETLPGYPKVEIDADPSEDMRYVTSENYNEEKYELLSTENFCFVSADEGEVVVCAGGDSQGPLTFSIKANAKTGKLHITDIYPGFSDGLTYDEFDDMLRNL